MVTHISLDLETWGTRPGADIRSIGACVFDPVRQWVPDPSVDLAMVNDRPVEPRFYIACDNAQDTPHGWRDALGAPPRKYPLHRDPRTVQWWSEQSDEAQAAFADPVDLREALDRFDHWLRQVAPQMPGMDLRIWSHGAAFDPPILAEAYHAVGLPVPWHYRAPRDTRTLFDMAGIDDHSAWLNQHPGPLGVSHHSLDDSICQARAVCAAWVMGGVQ